VRYFIVSVTVAKTVSLLAEEVVPEAFCALFLRSVSSVVMSAR
jgi:hypothetical protein